VVLPARSRSISWPCGGIHRRDKTYNTLLREVPRAIYTESNYSTKLRITVCGGTQYPYDIRQPATEPCIDIKTRVFS
jgi:hypothetical protein